MLITARPALPGRFRRTTLMVLLASATLAPATAGASGQQVLADCAAGKLAPSYPLADYRAALDEMPADMAEYTACASEIKASRDRMLASASKGAPTGKGSASTDPSAAVTPYAGSSKATVIPPGTASTAGGEELESTGDDDAGNDQNASPDATSATSPTTPPRTQNAPTHEVADDAFLAMPVAGSGGGDSAVAGAGGGSIPVIPAIIAFCVIALTATRGLIAWSRRPERLGDDADTAARAA